MAYIVNEAYSRFLGTSKQRILVRCGMVVLGLRA